MIKLGLDSYLTIPLTRTKPRTRWRSVTNYGFAATLPSLISTITLAAHRCKLAFVSMTWNYSSEGRIESAFPTSKPGSNLAATWELMRRGGSVASSDPSYPASHSTRSRSPTHERYSPLGKLERTSVETGNTTIDKLLTSHYP